MMCPGHVVISADSVEQIQRDPLNLSDFHALKHVIEGFNGIGIGYYNSGPQAGCSQMHKHLQFAPLTDNPVLDKMLAGAELPFKYFRQELASYNAHVMLTAYEALMKMLETECYNVIVSQKVMIIVPRRQMGNKTGIVVNALGFSGHFLTWDYNVEEIAKEPMQVLIDAGVPTQP